MTAEEKAAGYIGLAARGRRAVSGEFSVEQAVKSGKAFLVLAAGDASDNTKKKFRNMCDYYHVPMAEYSIKEELGRWIGKTYRASICILDEGFANALMKKLSLNMEV